jgi:hypothetical protein
MILKRSNNLKAITFYEAAQEHRTRQPGGKIKRHYFGPQHIFKMSGGTRDINMDMNETVRELAWVLDDPDYRANAAVQGLKHYVGAMVPARRAGAFLDRGPTWLSSREWSEYQQVCAAAETSEPVRFMGEQLDPRDFVHLTHYIMTQTSLQGMNGQGMSRDPRLALIDKIEGEA